MKKLNIAMGLLLGVLCVMLISAFSVFIFVFANEKADPVKAEFRPAGTELRSYPRLTPEILKNAKYKLNTVIIFNRTTGRYEEASKFITLNNGIYKDEIPEYEPPKIYFLKDYVFGDLNDDGIDDAAVVLVSNGGGSGFFYDLKAIINKEGEPLEVAETSLGDRPKLQSIRIDNGAIIVNMLTHGPNDSMAEPRIEVTAIYRLWQCQTLQFVQE